MKRWMLLATTSLIFAVVAGCSTLDEKQRQWIFQPSDTSWNGNQPDADMQNVWIPFDSKVTGEPGKLHALWLPAQILLDVPGAPVPLPVQTAVMGRIAQAGQADQKNQTGLSDVAMSGAVPAALQALNQRPTGQAGPVLLYLHGARWNVSGSAQRIRRMQKMGFSVLAIDYRGFGKSSTGLPSEATADEDARVAWDWLRARHPLQPRYIFGHSLGGAIAIDLAAAVSDESGLMVENTFTSITDVVSTFKWGWLPFSLLVSQRFDSLQKIAFIGSPVIVVHGNKDTLIPSALGRRLYDAATTPKQFVLVDGGSHFNTNDVAQPQYLKAIRDVFKLNVARVDTVAPAGVAP